MQFHTKIDYSANTKSVLKQSVTISERYPDDQVKSQINCHLARQLFIVGPLSQFICSSVTRRAMTVAIRVHAKHGETFWQSVDLLEQTLVRIVYHITDCRYKPHFLELMHDRSVMNPFHGTGGVHHFRSDSLISCSAAIETPAAVPSYIRNAYSIWEQFFDDWRLVHAPKLKGCDVSSSSSSFALIKSCQTQHFHTWLPDMGQFPAVELVLLSFVGTLDSDFWNAKISSVLDVLSIKLLFRAASLTLSTFANLLSVAQAGIKWCKCRLHISLGH